jgi:hypothetical protein
VPLPFQRNNAFVETKAKFDCLRESIPSLPDAIITSTSTMICVVMIHDPYRVKLVEITKILVCTEKKL